MVNEVFYCDEALNVALGSFRSFHCRPRRFVETAAQFEPKPETPVLSM